MNKLMFASEDKAINKLFTNTMTVNLENNTTQGYKWIIETDLGVFTGTCLSIDEVNEEIAMLKNNAKILKKNIIPTFLTIPSLTNNNEEDKICSWNLTTNDSHASGISTSLKEAKRVVNSFGSTEVLKYNIVESFNTSK